MRRTGIAFLATVLAGAVLFVALGALRDSDDAFSLNAPVIGVVAEVPAGATFCQQGISVPVGGAFDGGRLPLGTDGRPGSALRVTLSDARDRPLARTTIRGGYADNSSPRFRFDRTFESGRDLRLCLTNVGDDPVYPYGAGGDPNPTSLFTLEGEPLPVDAAVVFERPTRSTLATVPDMLERAALFRTPRLSAALYGGLLLLLLIVATVGGTVAVRAAAREDAALPGDVPDDPDPTRRS